MKKRKKIPRNILDLLNSLEKLLALQNYDRSINFPEKNERPGFAASVRIEEDYQRLIVTIHPAFFESSLTDQREYLLHELCHTLITDIQWCAEEMVNGKLVTSEQIRIAVEKSTSKISNILDSLLLGYRGYARTAYADYLKKKRR